MALFPYLTWAQHHFCRKSLSSRLNSLLQAQSPRQGMEPQITIVACGFRAYTVFIRVKKSLVIELILVNRFGMIGFLYFTLCPTTPNLHDTTESTSFVPNKKTITLYPCTLIFPCWISEFMVQNVFPGLGIILQFLIAWLSMCLNRDDDRTNFSGPVNKAAYLRANSVPIVRLGGHKASGGD